MTREAAISRSVLSDQVKDRLLQAILDGRYPPGARIVETRVARELGTSQAPVREALRDLEALGVVETTAFRGARVRRPSAAELLEAFAIRAELESLGARLAIPRLTDDDLDELAGYVDRDAAGRRGRRRPRRGDGRRRLPRPDRRAGRQRHPRAGLADARAVLPDLHHDRRARAPTGAGSPTCTCPSSTRSAGATRTSAAEVLHRPLRQRRGDARQPLGRATPLEPADGRHRRGRRPGRLTAAAMPA